MSNPCAKTGGSGLTFHASDGTNDFRHPTHTNKGTATPSHNSKKAPTSHKSDIIMYPKLPNKSDTIDASAAETAKASQPTFTTASSLSKFQPNTHTETTRIPAKTTYSSFQFEEYPTNEGILHCGSITCPFAAPASIKTKNIIFQIKSLIESAIQLDPSLKNERWYNTYYKIWIGEGLLDNFDDLEYLEGVTCWPRKPHPSPTYYTILHNIESIIPFKVLFNAIDVPNVATAAITANASTSSLPSDTNAGSNTATVSFLPPPTSCKSHFIVQSISEIGILDEIDETLREEYDLISWDQDNVFAQKFGENYEPYFDDDDFYEKKHPLTPTN